MDTVLLQRRQAESEQLESTMQGSLHSDQVVSLGGGEGIEIKAANSHRIGRADGDAGEEATVMGADAPDEAQQEGWVRRIFEKEKALSTRDMEASSRDLDAAKADKDLLNSKLAEVQELTDARPAPEMFAKPLEMSPFGEEGVGSAGYAKKALPTQCEETEGRLKVLHSGTGQPVPFFTVPEAVRSAKKASRFGPVYAEDDALQQLNKEQICGRLEELGALDDANPNASEGDLRALLRFAVHKAERQQAHHELKAAQHLNEVNVWKADASDHLEKYVDAKATELMVEDPSITLEDARREVRLAILQDGCYDELVANEPILAETVAERAPEGQFIVRREHYSNGGFRQTFHAKHRNEAPRVSYETPGHFMADVEPLQYDAEGNIVLEEGSGKMLQDRPPQVVWDADVPGSRHNQEVPGPGEPVHLYPRHGYAQRQEAAGLAPWQGEDSKHELDRLAPVGDAQSAPDEAAELYRRPVHPLASLSVYPLVPPAPLHPHPAGQAPDYIRQVFTSRISPTSTEPPWTLHSSQPAHLANWANQVGTPKMQQTEDVIMPSSLPFPEYAWQ